jgi:uncharacterized membrane protein
MALVPTNARIDELEGEARLRAALRQARGLRAAVVMVHGYRFCPFSDPAHSPHEHILSFTPTRDCWKAVSWPRHLHVGRGGLMGISLGWSARASLAQSYAQAADTGAALARIARIVADERPGLPLHVIAHSLGARVVLSALPLLPAGALSRLILLSGAEYRGRAAAALDTPAGRSVRVLNIASRENLPFDIGFRTAIRPDSWSDLPLSAGLSKRAANWIDLRIDCPRHADRLARLGFRLRPPATRVCHWSGYMRPGVFPLYRALLSDRGGALFSNLRQALAPDPAPPAARAGGFGMGAKA